MSYDFAKGISDNSLVAVAVRAAVENMSPQAKRDLKAVKIASAPQKSGMVLNGHVSQASPNNSLEEWAARALISQMSPQERRDIQRLRTVLRNER